MTFCFLHLSSEKNDELIFFVYLFFLRIKNRKKERKKEKEKKLILVTKQDTCPWNSDFGAKEGKRSD